jgi:putative endonuclease
MFYVYILKSEKNNSYYIGYCSNIDRRLNQHNKGFVKSTKKYAPWKLVYIEEYKDRIEAMKREKQIKSWKKRCLIEKLIKHFKIL